MLEKRILKTYYKIKKTLIWFIQWESDYFEDVTKWFNLFATNKQNKIQFKSDYFIPGKVGSENFLKKINI